MVYFWVNEIETVIPLYYEMSFCIYRFSELSSIHIGNKNTLNLFETHFYYSFLYVFLQVRFKHLVKQISKECLK